MPAGPTQDAHVILVVGGAGEAAATVGLRAGVGAALRLCGCAHVPWADVRCSEGAATALMKGHRRGVHLWRPAG